MRINLQKNRDTIYDLLCESTFTLIIAVIFGFCQEIAIIFRNNSNCKLEDIFNIINSDWSSFLITLSGAMLITFFTYGYITFMKNRNVLNRNTLSIGNIFFVIILNLMLIWYLIKNIFVPNDLLAWVDICLTSIFSSLISSLILFMLAVEVEEESVNDDFKIA